MGLNSTVVALGFTLLICDGIGLRREDSTGGHGQVHKG